MPLRRKVKSSRSATGRRPRAEAGNGEELGKRMRKKTKEKSPQAEPRPTEELPEDLYDEEAVSEPMEPVEDLQLLEAQSTIERLRKKYLPKALDDSPGAYSLDIVRVEVESEVLHHGKENQTTMSKPDQGARSERIKSDQGARSERIESDQGVRSEQISKPDQGARSVRFRARKAQKEPLRVLERRRREESMGSSPPAFKTPVKRPPRSQVAATSPEVKVPRPTLGHSTPSSAIRGKPSRRSSLFGFEEALDSPLALSPVSSSPYIQAISFRSLESKPDKPSPYTRHLGTNDIPLRKPTPKKRCGKRKQQPSHTSEIDAWAKEMQAAFTEVDDFELAVE